MVTPAEILYAQARPKTTPRITAISQNKMYNNLRQNIQRLLFVSLSRIFWLSPEPLYNGQCFIKTLIIYAKFLTFPLTSVVVRATTVPVCDTVQLKRTLHFTFCHFAQINETLFIERNT